MLEEDGGCGWMDEGIGVCGPYKVLGGGGWRSKTGVCGFQSVQPVVVSSPKVCRDCGLTVHAHRHTISHTISSGFE